MRALLGSLDRRMRRNRKKWPRLRWQTVLFITANLVILSALLYDPPFARSAKEFSAPMRTLGRNLTDLGKPGWIICISAFLLFEGWALSRLLCSTRCRGRAIQVSAVGAYILVSVAASGILANLLKRMIGRARPERFEEWGVFSFHPFAGSADFESFPSGHSTTIGALFMGLALLCPRWALVFTACALWLAMTRLMVGAHYPSDVIAGLSLGSWFSFLIAIVFSRYGLIFSPNSEGWPILRRPLPWA